MANSDHDRYIFDRLSDSGLPVFRGSSWGPYPPRCPRATYVSHPGYGSGDNMAMASQPHYSASLVMSDWDEKLVRDFERIIGDLGTYSRHDEFDEAAEKHVARFDFCLEIRGAA